MKVVVTIRLYGYGLENDVQRKKRWNNKEIFIENKTCKQNVLKKVGNSMPRPPVYRTK